MTIRNWIFESDKLNQVREQSDCRSKTIRDKGGVYDAPFIEVVIVLCRVVEHNVGRLCADSDARASDADQSTTHEYRCAYC